MGIRIYVVVLVWGGGEWPGGFAGAALLTAGMAKNKQCNFMQQTVVHVQ